MFICLNCKKVLKTVEFDGYAFGDRLLEGVNFLADFTTEDEQPQNVRIDPDHADYFEGLNQQKWLKEAADHAKELPQDVATCPDCKEDVGWLTIDESIEELKNLDYSDEEIKEIRILLEGQLSGTSDGQVEP